MDWRRLVAAIDKLIRECCPDGVKHLPLGELCRIRTGQSISRAAIAMEPGEYPVINSGVDPLGSYARYNTEDDPLGITSRGAGVGSVTWCEGKFFRGNLNYSASVRDRRVMDARFLYHFLLYGKAQIDALSTFSGIPALNVSNLVALEVPVPPMEVQRAIAEILDEFTKLEAELEAELEARRKQYAYYRDQLLKSSEGLGESSQVVLGDICTIETGKLDANAAVKSGAFEFFTTAKETSHIDVWRWDEEALLIAGNANVGDVKHYVGKFEAYQRTYVLTRFDRRVCVRYLFHLVSNGLQEYLSGRSNSAAMTYILLGTLKAFPVPVPTLADQERIVAILDEFDALVNDISVGLPAELAARRKQYEYYRDKLLTFTPLGA